MGNKKWNSRKRNRCSWLKSREKGIEEIQKKSGDGLSSRSEKEKIFLQALAQQRANQEVQRQRSPSQTSDESLVQQASIATPKEIPGFFYDRSSNRYFPLKKGVRPKDHKEATFDSRGKDPRLEDIAVIPGARRKRGHIFTFLTERRLEGPPPGGGRLVAHRLARPLPARFGGPPGAAPPPPSRAQGGGGGGGPGGRWRRWPLLLPGDLPAEEEGPPRAGRSFRVAHHPQLPICATYDAFSEVYHMGIEVFVYPPGWGGGRRRPRGGGGGGGAPPLGLDLWERVPSLPPSALAFSAAAARVTLAAGFLPTSSSFGASASRNVEIIGLQNEEGEATSFSLRGPTKGVWSLKWSKVDTHLLAIGASKCEQMSILNVESQQEMKLGVVSSDVFCIDFLPEWISHRTLIIGQRNGQVSLLDMRSKKSRLQLGMLPCGAAHLAAAPGGGGGALAVAADRSGGLRALDFRRGGGGGGAAAAAAVAVEYRRPLPRVYQELGFFSYDHQFNTILSGKPGSSDLEAWHLSSGERIYSAAFSLNGDSKGKSLIRMYNHDVGNGHVIGSKATDRTDLNFGCFQVFKTPAIGNALPANISLFGGEALVESEQETVEHAGYHHHHHDSTTLGSGVHDAVMEEGFGGKHSNVLLGNAIISASGGRLAFFI